MRLENPTLRYNLFNAHLLSPYCDQRLEEKKKEFVPDFLEFSLFLKKCDNNCDGAMETFHTYFF